MGVNARLKSNNNYDKSKNRKPVSVDVNNSIDNEPKDSGDPKDSAAQSKVDEVSDNHTVDNHTVISMGLPEPDVRPIVTIKRDATGKVHGFKIDSRENSRMTADSHLNKLLEQVRKRSDVEVSNHED